MGGYGMSVEADLHELLLCANNQLKYKIYTTENIELQSLKNNRLRRESVGKGNTERRYREPYRP